MKLVQPNQTENHQTQNRGFFSATQGLFQSMSKLARSEASLVRAEITENSKTIGKHVGYAVAFGVIALVGILPFVAFLCIGLGRLLGDNYWLSSLIVSIVLTAVGAFVGYIFARRLADQDLSLPHTRNSIQNETQIIKDKVHEISDAIKRRAS